MPETQYDQQAICSLKGENYIGGADYGQQSGNGNQQETTSAPTTANPTTPVPTTPVPAQVEEKQGSSGDGDDDNEEQETTSVPEGGEPGSGGFGGFGGPNQQQGGDQGDVAARKVTGAYTATEDIPAGTTASDLLASSSYVTAKKNGLALALSVDSSTVTILSFTLSRRRSLAALSRRRSLAVALGQKKRHLTATDVQTSYEIAVAASVSQTADQVADALVVLLADTATATAVYLFTFLNFLGIGIDFKLEAS